MKTIKERAKEAVIDPLDPDEMLPVRLGYLSMLERRGFVAGAMSERNELLRWRNPKDSPERGKDVLLKIQLVGNDETMYSVGYWYDSYFSNTLGHHGVVIGWRPIYETNRTMDILTPHDGVTNDKIAKAQIEAVERKQNEYKLIGQLGSGGPGSYPL